MEGTKRPPAPAAGSPRPAGNSTMEEGWVLIEKQDTLDDVVVSSAARPAGGEVSSADASSGLASGFAQFYPHHLDISTNWVTGVGCYSRWVSAQWQECERYARYIAHFFPGEDVVERRRAAAEEERERAMREAHYHQEVELTRRRTIEAQRRKESESMYMWLEAILQRWAAIDAQKRNQQEVASGSDICGRSSSQSHHTPSPSSDGNSTQHQVVPRESKPIEKIERQEQVPELRLNHDVTQQRSSEVQTNTVGSEKEGEERKRLKEEGRRRFKEMKQKEQSEVIASSSTVPPTTTEANSLTNSLGEWELINAADSLPSESKQPIGDTACEQRPSISAEAEIECSYNTPNIDAMALFQERSLTQLHQFIKQSMGERPDIRCVPFQHSEDKALAGFEHWRRSLWFAPAGFSQMIDSQKLEAVWIPYYTMRLTVISSFKSKVLVSPPAPATQDEADSPQQKPRKAESKEISVSKESSYESLLVCASVNEVDQVLMKSIEDWCITATSEIKNTSSSTKVANAGATQGDLLPVSVREMMSANDAWKKAEKEIIAREKEACREQIQSEHNPQKIQHLILTKLTFKGRPSFSIIYMPVYFITYVHNGKEYAYVANGQTGKASGERPYGVGNVIGGGIGMLENIFGISEQETAGILSGQALKKVDSSPYYKEAGWYLVFPPSHSYLITSATGYITLRNAGTREILLSSQPRGGEKVIATYVLRSGETETFDYKGNWCIELKYAEGDRGQPDIELVEFHTSGGGHFGNKLGMSYWLL